MRRNPIIIFALLALCFLTVSPLEGKAAKKKGPNAEEVLQKGREAFFNYDFDEAFDLYNEYRSLKTKAKEEVEEEFEIWETELEIASNAFERVRKIVIVDSISVPSARFFETYKLAQSAGNIAPATTFADINNTELAFINEGGDLLIYPKENSEGELQLIERTMLLNGEWEERDSLTGDFEKSGDYAYPFMSSDGQTLYFANNGEESMGGYDIFVAQREAMTGEYRQPLNLGMPFNSPYDDIMLAIDEENGLGWWATDRNSEEGKITVYVFLNEEIRKNYPSDTENLASFARIDSYKDTWKDEKNQEIIPVMPSISKTLHATDNGRRDFTFPLGNGKVYYSYSDFKNPKAAEVMKKYLAKNKELSKATANLEQLRKQYKTSKSVEEKIIQAESEVEELRTEIRSLKSEILRIEKGS